MCNPIFMKNYKILYLFVALLLTASVTAQKTYQPNWESIEAAPFQPGSKMPNLVFLFIGVYTRFRHTVQPKAIKWAFTNNMPNGIGAVG